MADDADIDVSIRPTGHSSPASLTIDEIMSVLQTTRDRYNDELSRINNDIKRFLSHERSSALAKCRSKMNSLSVGDRAIVANHLLSSEEFENEIDLSQLRTWSEGVGLLTWSCADSEKPLSDRSWRKGTNALSMFCCMSTRLGIVSD